MRFGEESVAGIDISQDRISIVLLKNGKNGPELVKSVVGPVPQGAVKDGNIEDAALLSKAIWELKFRNHIWTKRAAMSLFARPVVVQIIDMPQQMPSNIRQFVNNEIKNCVVLPSRDITIDFCGIGSVKRAADKRVFVVAAESARMVELVRACAKGGFRVERIEPSLVAYLRAIRSQKVAGKSGHNVLVAILRGTDSTSPSAVSSGSKCSPLVALTLCVLRNGSVDFIRAKEMAPGPGSSDDLNCWLSEELSEVIRFYDIDVPGNTGKWEIDVFIDCAQPHQATEKFLKSRIETSYLQVRTIEDAYMDTPVDGSSARENEKPSPVAVGLAMNLLTARGDDLRVNLVPREIERLRETKRDILITANVIAVMLLAVVLAIGQFTAMFGRSHRNAAVKQLLIEKQNTDGAILLNQHIDDKLQVLSSRLDRIAEIRALQPDVNWAELFDEIRRATPAPVRITGLSSLDGTRVLVSGLALSNEAVNLFVGLLEKSQSLKSVTLLETHEQDGPNKLITYQLSCKLAIRSDKVGNVK
jgi:Tfp pilus assembly protein PilN